MAGQWFAPVEGKRFTEKLFLALSAVWISWFGVIVATDYYKTLGDVGYMCIGLAIALPYVFVPLLVSSRTERRRPLLDRYWVKANIWVAIFSYVGNYFWTHYFYKVLGAAYSFPVEIELNGVPVFLYLITHGYFAFYFTLSTMVIRRVRTGLSPEMSSVTRLVVMILLITLMSWATAFMETFTISSVPYYTHKDKYMMYTVGSVFYGIYFYVGFPMFYRIDEDPKERWSWTRSAIDSLAASMLVFVFLDLARLIVGSTQGLPWLS